METTKEKLSKTQINEFIRELSKEHPNIENQDFDTIASMISSRFQVDCSKKDVMSVFEEDIFTEDFEHESRKIEHGSIDF